MSSPTPSSNSSLNRSPNVSTDASSTSLGLGARARADRLALSLFEQLRDRPLVDRRFVLRALLAREAKSAGSVRSDVSLEALHVCCQAHGDQAVSRREYDAWRSEQLAPRELASATLIRRTFGSWTKALRALGYQADGDARACGLLSNQSSGFSRAELVIALRALAPGDGRRLTVDFYRAAARAHNDALEPGESRYPLGLAPFLRVFGSWARALAAAGLPLIDTPGQSDAADRYSDVSERVHVSDKASDALASFDDDRRDDDRRGDHRRGDHTDPCRKDLTATAANGRLTVGRRADYAPERILACLKRAAEDVGTKYLTMKAYDAWAQATVAATLERGQVEVLPRSKSISQQFGGWAEALRAADLMSEAERSRWGQGGFSYTDEDLLEGLRRALRHFQGPPSKNAYIAWRRRELARAAAPKGLGLAMPHLISLRFGGWTKALAEAGEGDTALEGYLRRTVVRHRPSGPRRRVS